MESDIIKLDDSDELRDIINESIEKVISEGGDKEFYRRLYSDIFGIGDL